MNKPMTQATLAPREGLGKAKVAERQLEKDRKLQADIRRAGQVAGADYSPERWIPSWQSSEFGAGSGVNVKEDMPTHSHYFEGFLFKKNEKEPFDWEIILEGLATPKPLQGRWTSVPAMEKAVRDYLSRNAMKGTN